ncbi:MAG: hypothetical protein FI707_10900 [SAR202 cluster bacterium]|nr:hypothetical protein [Acidobacteriota bacterium]MBU81859.1 hypothetical protein [Chloroflexota bacterium]MDP6800059.1 hypothetical protein [SAR202 cluster bacterium]HCV24849.1 hypothetical protein [Candidatus Latescibacterota bacterium]MQG58450.1 hypothetical protein [SAR202 cluster bacterium]
MPFQSLCFRRGAPAVQTEEVRHLAGFGCAVRRVPNQRVQFLIVEMELDDRSAGNVDGDLSDITSKYDRPSAIEHRLRLGVGRERRQPGERR